ncbi:MAG TPA: heme lyase CcmF/NrfE family subunit [Miltoncostaeaceae bacterium]|nr:heme lyase CcmF/NrfE family subunit [Miltoncostaeaceae bacterium]
MSLFGRTVLLLALGLAVYALVMALAARRPGGWPRQRSAERAVYALAVMVSLAMLGMWVAFVTDDFTLRNVAEYTSTTLPLQFKLTAVWGSQAGSLLLWMWIFSLFCAAALWFNRNRNRELMPIVIATLMVVAIFFLVLLSFITSPFETLATVPQEGRGLNPQLQNYYMQVHPPLLYLGYVGLTIPFAFAVAALVTGRLDTTWITSVRRWTIFSWLFLGIGMLVGAKWAYETLGWGGYWAWDPVENAAFMPWLVATAFLHSVMVQERRGMLKVWNMVLVVLTFCLCLFGTFLTRSGVIQSVHAFGESTLGPFFLGFIVLVAAFSFVLIIRRLDDLRSQHSLESYLSREAVFLYNNLLLLALAFAVFWGTMFPVLTEAVRGERIVVGQGFYEQVAAPIGIALLLLMGVGPLIPWRKTTAVQLRRRFLGPLIAAVVIGVPLLLFTDLLEHWVAGLTVVACVFVAACILSEFRRGAVVRHAVGGISWPGAVLSMIGRNRRRYGGYIVHLGVVLMFIGFAGSRGFATEADVVIPRGQTVQASGYSFTNLGARQIETPHAVTTEVTLAVSRDGQRVATLVPGIHRYRVDQSAGSQVALNSTPRRDLYVVLTRVERSGEAMVSVYVNPLVLWLWIAGYIIAFGGLIAAWPTRALPRAATAAARVPRGSAGAT